MGALVKLNDEVLDLDMEGMSKIGDIYEKLTSEFFDDKEIVTEIHINDRIVDTEDFLATLDTSLEDVERLSFKTLKNPARQVASLLGKMNGYLSGFAVEIDKVADKFRLGSIEEANVSLLEAIDGLVALNELLSTVRMVSSPDINTLQNAGKSMEDLEKGLLDVTEEIRKGQEGQDWVTVADLLEYELSPLMKEWKEMIPHLEKEVLKSS